MRVLDLPYFPVRRQRELMPSRKARSNQLLGLWEGHEIAGGALHFQMQFQERFQEQFHERFQKCCIFRGFAISQPMILRASGLIFDHRIIREVDRRLRIRGKDNVVSWYQEERA